MFVKELHLIGFRNYLEAAISFDREKVIIVGKNAQGKTNLLEVIQILSGLKSKRASKDKELINFELNDAVVRAKTSEDQIAVQIRPSGRRSIKVNEINKKNSELTEHMRSVSFMVDDLEIVAASPSHRRDWIDAVLKQSSSTMHSEFKEFEKVLSQRNSFIKKLLEQGRFHLNLTNSDKEQLEIWDEMFINAANKIIELRAALLKEITPIAETYYARIAAASPNQEENLGIEYLGEKITEEELKKSLAKDFARGFTSIGPQRHDIEFSISDKKASSFASQGQRRSIVLALKLAELELLRRKHQDSPILLLDDVLAELDEDRQDFLLDAIETETQVIITTTHLGKHIDKWSQNAQILEIEQGRIKTGATA